MATQAVPTPDTNWTGLFETRNREVHDRMDSIFKKLLIAQWVALVVIALVVSPSSWNGGEKGVHMHVWLALLGGGAVALFPLFLTASEGSTRLSRSVTASAQVVFSSLLIHILGGRIEAHFHLFVSLAIIAAYRDYVPLLAATAIAAVDHIVRGVFFPASLFGVDQASFLRVLEHLVYAVFEVGVLCITIRMSLEETRRSAKLQAESVEESRRQQEDQIVRAQEAVRAFIESKVSHALTGIKEMANAIEVNSVAAGELANHSNENGRLAEEGNRAMGDMIDQIQQLVGAIDDGQGQLEALQASSTQIRQVTKLIEDLAFQTNLLALNAAVEAARAGEYGSGFAVVAEEVRALAVRTSSAVTEIDEMTTSIAQETDSVRSTISGASERAAASMAVVRDARQRLEAVEQSSETMAQLVSSVAAATEEQSVSSRELAQLVEGFTKYGSDG